MVSECGTRDECAAGTLVESFCLKFAPGMAPPLGDPDWCAGLWTTGNDEKLPPVLEKLALMDADDATVRKKLLQMALKNKDLDAASKWANHSFQVLPVFSLTVFKPGSYAGVVATSVDTSWLVW